MAKIAIPTKQVTCQDGTKDLYVSANTNTTADERVQAFVDLFRSYAETASATCYNLPVKFILTQWGGESLWASARTQQQNQNWVNMSYGSPTNPVGNIGQAGKWAIFEGINKHAVAYAQFLIKNSFYTEFINYLKDCQKTNKEPDIYECIRLIAYSGFGGTPYEEYEDELLGYLATLEKRSDIDGGGDNFNKIPVSANLTVVGDNVRVRTTPPSGTEVTKLNNGASIKATERALIGGDPWFHISQGWISGKYIRGWVMDDNNEGKWWYIDVGYKYTVGDWKTIDNASYCFGKDGYMFKYCYVKSLTTSTYYWIDARGVWIPDEDTKSPDRSYRVVENIKTNNAYVG